MSCNNLTVSTSIPGVTISPAGEIHGHIDAALPTQIVYGNTGSYGPDAQLRVYKGSDLVAVLHVQQNYCVMSAGKVNANVVAGKCAVTTNEGSFGNGTGGTVTIVSAG